MAVDGVLEARIGPQGSQLRAKQKGLLLAATAEAPIQGLFSKAVAGELELVITAIYKGQGPHAYAALQSNFQAPSFDGS